MDLLIILRDAHASSFIGGLLTAMTATEAGRKVGVLVTQEALAAVAGGTFGWPRELSGQEMRLTLADQGATLGIPLLGRGEGRQLDAKGLLRKAREAGVTAYACPTWTTLLNLQGQLPDGLDTLDPTGALTLIEKSKRVVGTL
jgi:hypothetical protein